MNICGPYQYKGWARGWVWKLGINWPPFFPTPFLGLPFFPHSFLGPPLPSTCPIEITTSFQNAPGKYVDCSDFLGVLVGGEHLQKMDHEKGFWKSYYLCNKSPVFWVLQIKQSSGENFVTFWHNFLVIPFVKHCPLNYTVCTVLSTKVMTINTTSSSWDATEWSYIKIIN
jgi:hypothetical protein